METRLTVACAVAASVVVAAACSGDIAGNPQVTARVTEAVSGSAFYYFRCNNTDWGADEGSRMKPTLDPRLVSITVHVATPSDVCSVTQVIATSPDSWGTSQSFLTTSSTLVVPASAPLVAKTTEVNFAVKYPSTGTFVATFNTATSTVAVAAAATVEGLLVQGLGSGVAGTIATLKGPSGATMASTVTNANGAFAFASVAPATYSVGFAATPSGAQPTYAVSPSSLAVLGQAVIVGATCTPTASAACTAGAPVLDPFHQLVVVDPAVTDPAQDPRASNVTDGHFSLRYVLESLSGCPNASTNAGCVSTFTKAFLLNMSAVQTVDGFTVPARNGQNLVAIWPKLADGQTLDFTQTPFELLAIVNRTDLHSTGQGEARLVYGEVLTTPGLPPQRGAFSLIVEFALPATGSLTNRAGWVNAFFALPTEDSKGAQLACASSTNPECAFAFDLQTLTDQFIAPAQLIDVRTNEIELSPGEGSTWAWRQFVLATSGGSNELVTAATPETPPPSLNGSSAVATFIGANGPPLRTGFVSLPLSFTGGQAEDISQAPWSFPSIDKATLHAFSGRTCNGCHLFEPSDPTQTSGPTFHVNPTIAPSATGQNLLSFFVTQIEIPRRESFMTNWLGCTSTGQCAPGADVALMQP